MLYQMTGKPIMINNTAILHSEPLFEPTSIYATKDKLWFTVKRINALFCMDKENWNLEFVGCFPEEKDFTENEYDSLYYYPTECNDSLYFPPFLAEEFALMSLKDKTFSKIRFKEKFCTPENSKNFSGAVTIDNYVYFTPSMYPAIIRLNTETKELAYFTDWLESVNKLANNTDNGYFGIPLLVGTSIWLASYRGNIVVKFDTETCTSNVYEIGAKDYRFRKVSHDGDNFWITPLVNSKTQIIKWNPEKGLVKEFQELNADIDPRGFMLSGYCAGYIWLLPWTTGHAYKIDTRTDEISVAMEFSLPNVETVHPTRGYIAMLTTSDNIYVFNEREGKLLDYSPFTNNQREKTITYTKEISSEVKRLFIKSHIHEKEKLSTIDAYSHYESNSLLLGCYIDSINSEYDEKTITMENRRVEISNSLTNNSNGTCGQVIYSYIKGTI